MLLDRFHNRFHHSKHKGDSNSTSTKKTSSIAVDAPPTQSGDAFVLSQPVPLSLNIQKVEPELDYEYEDNEDMISMVPSIHTPLATTPVSYGQNPFNSNKNNFNNLEGSTPFNGSHFPPYLHMKDRQNSASSLASSISDFHGGVLRQQAVANAVGGAGNFTSQFLSLLMEVYQSLCSDPTVTPFDTSNPPSGILNTVAKIAIEQSRNTGVEIGYERNSWLLTLVRHRLLEEVRKDGYFSRNNSNISLPPPPPQFMEMMNSTNFHSPSITNTCNNPTDYFSKQQPYNQDCFGNVLGVPSVNRNNNLMRSRSNSSQVLLARTRSNSNGVFALTPTTSENSLAAGFNIGLNLNTNMNHTNLLSRQRSNSGITTSPATTPVNSSFNLVGEENIVLETLRKKRESLRLKR